MAFDADMDSAAQSAERAASVAVSEDDWRTGESAECLGRRPRAPSRGHEKTSHMGESCAVAEPRKRRDRHE